MRLLLVLLMASFNSSLFANDCACNIYPFKPNPPCFENCVRFLVQNKDVKIADVKGIEPRVVLSIFALRNDERGAVVNFDAIKDRDRLEAEAVKAIPSQGEWRM